jgi:hypothetical protein
MISQKVAKPMALIAGASGRSPYRGRDDEVAAQSRSERD